MGNETRSRGGLVAGALPSILGLGALFCACYPSGVTNVSDYNTVSTVYDTAFSAAGGFQKLLTYSMPGATTANPQNCVIEDLADGGTFVFTNPAFQTTICTTVENQLDNLGYVLVNAAVAPNQTPPDFILTVSALNQSYTAYISYPWYGYWGGYYPYYPWGGWGIYYPWTSFYYSYNVGTLVMTMVRPDTDVSIVDGGQMDAIWAGALNGVVSGANITPTTVAAGIVQAFNQSPYLGSNQ